MRSVAGLSRHVTTKRPELTCKAAYQRTAQVLAKLKLDGIVGRDGRMWGLAQTDQVGTTQLRSSCHQRPYAIFSPFLSLTVIV